MSEKGNGKLPRIGVYICHCGLNIANVVDVEAVAEFAGKLPGVVVAKAYKYMCSDPGLEMIKADIKEQNLERVVVASCSPLLHEQTFRRAIQEGGILNPYLYTHVNIREHVSWVHASEPAKATEKAKALVAAAVRRVSAHKPLERKRVDVNPDVLVLGGGIAGIQASLVLADSGKKVYLVEREPSIGGHMAKFDKTFPTLDCAACILTPKMAQVGNHPNIELLTYSELKEIEGYVGNFKAKVLKKSRHLYLEKCTACGECAKVCPVEIPSAFDENLAKRKATYRPFPQAVPNKFVIERLGYPPCQAACPIHQNAYGYMMMVKEGKFAEALEVVLRDNPLPSLCGWVCTHPCTDTCTRGKVDAPLNMPGIKRFIADHAGDFALPMPKDFKENGKKVAVIGGGPAGLTAAYELRKRGYQVTIYEAAGTLGGMPAITIPDYRLPKDVLKKDTDRIAATGIEVRLNTALGKDVSLSEITKQYSAVFIAVGASKNRRLGVPGEDNSWVLPGLEFLGRVNSGERPNLGRRVVVIGGGLVAVDAARTAVRLGANVTLVCIESWEEMFARRTSEGQKEVEQMKAEGVEVLTRWGPKEFKSGGIELKSVIRVFDESGRFSPQYDETKTRFLECDTAIVAIGQAPDSDLFKSQGLSVTSWGGLDVDPVTLQTNIENVFAGGDVLGPDVVVTAMMAGKKAAESIDRFLNGRDLYEGRELEGPFEGVARPMDLERVERKPAIRMPEREPSVRIKDFADVHSTYSPEDAQKEASRCLMCSICCDCQLCKPACPVEGCIDYSIPDEEIELNVGAVVVATGFKIFDPKRIPSYGYGKYPEVYTSLEIERLVNSSGPTEGKLVMKNGQPPKSVAIVHCVGSRDKNYNEYCSRVCCMYSLKLAHLVHERTGAEVYNFYIDMRTPGKGYEEFYHKLLDEGIHFIRGRVAEITDWAIEPSEKGKLVVRVEDTMAGMVRRIPVDMVILSVGLEPQPDAQDIRRLLKLSCSSEGFFLERHPKLAPVSTVTAGIYIAGACQGPKDIPDTVAQAGAAAGEVLAMVDRGYIELEPIKAHIDAEDCSGCKMCNGLCPYDAITYDKERKVSEINEVLCEGCGTCVAACPSGAIDQDLFENQELLYEIEGVLKYV
ncbi:MAG: FAD-dependent oxidoreductase [candidate division WOR-3 bacterium]